MSKTKKEDSFLNELIIWITLLVSVILVLCVFGLCGPLSNVFGAFLFGMFGFMAYIFPFALFFSIGFYILNKENKKVVGRIIAGWGLFIIIASLIHLFYLDDVNKILEFYKFGYTEKAGGGFIGGLISLGLKSAMGTLAATIVLMILALILTVYITGKLIATMVLDGSKNKVKQIKDERSSAPKKVKARTNGEKYVKREVPSTRRKYTYTFDEAEEEVRSAEQKKKKASKTVEPEKKEDVQIGDDIVTIHRGGKKEQMPIYEREIDEKFGKPVKAAKIDIIPDEPEINPQDELDDLDKLIEKATDKSAPDMEEIMSEVNKPQTTAPKESEKAEAAPVSDEPITELDIQTPPEPIKYTFPSIELLNAPKRNKQGMSEKELKDTAIRLKECLKSFKVEVTITDIICGPTVTRYELMPALGTRVKKITELENDIKLNLAAKDIRIEAPIPGKSAVGIEVPNSGDSLITLREILETEDFNNHKSNIAFGTGKDISGRNIIADIAKMPHLLIAGSTGSGKSVCINTIVMSLLYKADPNDVKLIMVDPKVVELSVYNGIPHLLLPVVTDPKKAAAALNWAVAEMNDRYQKFAEFGVRDMAGFNKKLETLKSNPNMYTKMPQIVIIVDELADLMMVASHDVETAICRLAQMARAAGLHLIIATQRPSVDVITGLIKANVPSRIAFAVSSSIDSRTILDASGAEKLLGKGDMLFSPQDLNKPVRVQGAFVSDGEVAKVTEFIKKQYEGQTTYDTSIQEKIANTELTGKGSTATAAADADEGDGRDELFAEAGRFIIEKQKASIGTLQRVFKIGFNRGARIMDQLYEAGVVGEDEGKKPRNIIMTLQEFEDFLGQK